MTANGFFVFKNIYYGGEWQVSNLGQNFSGIIAHQAQSSDLFEFFFGVQSNLYDFGPVVLVKKGSFWAKCQVNLKEQKIFFSIGIGGPYFYAMYGVAGEKTVVKNQKNSLSLKKKSPLFHEREKEPSEICGRMHSESLPNDLCELDWDNQSTSDISNNGSDNGFVANSQDCFLAGGPLRTSTILESDGNFRILPSPQVPLHYQTLKSESAICQLFNQLNENKITNEFQQNLSDLNFKSSKIYLILSKNLAEIHDLYLKIQLCEDLPRYHKNFMPELVKTTKIELSKNLPKNHKAYTFLLERDRPLTYYESENSEVRREETDRYEENRVSRATKKMTSPLLLAREYQNKKLLLFLTCVEGVKEVGWKGKVAKKQFKMDFYALEILSAMLKIKRNNLAFLEQWQVRLNNGDFSNFAQVLQQVSIEEIKQILDDCVFKNSAKKMYWTNLLNRGAKEFVNKTIKFAREFFILWSLLKAQNIVKAEDTLSTKIKNFDFIFEDNILCSENRRADFLSFAMNADKTFELSNLYSKSKFLSLVKQSEALFQKKANKKSKLEKVTSFILQVNDPIFKKILERSFNFTGKAELLDSFVMKFNNLKNKEMLSLELLSLIQSIVKEFNPTFSFDLGADIAEAMNLIKQASSEIDALKLYYMTHLSIQKFSNIDHRAHQKISQQQAQVKDDENFHLLNTIETSRKVRNFIGQTTQSVNAFFLETSIDGVSFNRANLKKSTSLKEAADSFESPISQNFNRKLTEEDYKQTEFFSATALAQSLNKNLQNMDSNRFKRDLPKIYKNFSIDDIGLALLDSENILKKGVANNLSLLSLVFNSRTSSIYSQALQKIEILRMQLSGFLLEKNQIQIQITLKKMKDIVKTCLYNIYIEQKKMQKIVYFKIYNEKATKDLKEIMNRLNTLSLLQKQIFNDSANSKKYQSLCLNFMIYPNFLEFASDWSEILREIKENNFRKKVTLIEGRLFEWISLIIFAPVQSISILIARYGIKLNFEKNMTVFQKKEYIRKELNKLPETAIIEILDQVIAQGVINANPGKERGKRAISSMRSKFKSTKEFLTQLRFLAGADNFFQSMSESEMIFEEKFLQLQNKAQEIIEKIKIDKKIQSLFLQNDDAKAILKKLISNFKGDYFDLQIIHRFGQLCHINVVETELALKYMRQNNLTHLSFKNLSQLGILEAEKLRGYEDYEKLFALYQMSFNTQEIKASLELQIKDAKEKLNEVAVRPLVALINSNLDKVNEEKIDLNLIMDYGNKLQQNSNIDESIVDMIQKYINSQGVRGFF